MIYLYPVRTVIKDLLHTSTFKIQQRMDKGANQPSKNHTRNPYNAHIVELSTNRLGKLRDERYNKQLPIKEKSRTHYAKQGFQTIKTSIDARHTLLRGKDGATIAYIVP